MLLKQDDSLHRIDDGELVSLAKKNKEGEEVLCKYLARRESLAILEGLEFIQAIMMECGLQELNVSELIKIYRDCGWDEPTLYIQILSALENIPSIKEEINRCYSEVLYDSSSFSVHNLEDNKAIYLSVEQYKYVYIIAYFDDSRPLETVFIPYAASYVPHTSFIKELVMFHKVHESINKDQDFIHNLKTSRKYKSSKLKSLFKK